MKYLEVRRHTMRVKPGHHLSQDGVSLARRVGENMGTFDHVITSHLPRAFETAIAMGFAVDGEYEILAKLGDEVEAEVRWPATFPTYAAAIAEGGAVHKAAKAQADFWRKFVRTLPEGGRGLMISHGGVVEVGIIGSMPHAPAIVVDTWGDPIDYCEGAGLTFEGDRCIQITILRVGHDQPAATA